MVNYGDSVYAVYDNNNPVGIYESKEKAFDCMESCRKSATEYAISRGVRMSGSFFETLINRFYVKEYVVSEPVNTYYQREKEA